MGTLGEVRSHTTAFLQPPYRGFVSSARGCVGASTDVVPGLSRSVCWLQCARHRIDCHHSTIHLTHRQAPQHRSSMADHVQSIAHHIARRLEDATSFSGQLKCSFDPSMLLNLTDLTQPFLMTCKSPPVKGLNGWWIALIVIGSIVAPIVLGFMIYFLAKCIRSWRSRANGKRLERLRADAEAARNDYMPA